jgi:hypothetical protein
MRRPPLESREATAPEIRRYPAKPREATNTSPLRPGPLRDTSASPSGQQSQDSSPPTAAPAPQEPTSQELDKAGEDLMKLHARAEAVKTSLDALRVQQAASGVGVRPDVAASASRMDSYLQAADRALQHNRLDFARKSMNSGEQEISKLEALFGR